MAEAGIENPWRLAQVSRDKLDWFLVPGISGDGQPDTARNQENATNEEQAVSRSVHSGDVSRLSAAFPQRNRLA